MVFILSTLCWIRIRALRKLPDGRDWLWGKLGLSLMGGAKLSKSLIKFSVDGWGCVPFLFFDVRPKMAEVRKIMVTSILGGPTQHSSYSFTDLEKAVVRVIILVSFLWMWFSVCDCGFQYCYILAKLKGKDTASQVAQWWRICLPSKRCGFDPWVGQSPRVGNDTPFHYSYLINAMDRGAWQAIIHGVAKSQTWVSNLDNNEYLLHRVFFFFPPFGLNKLTNVAYYSAC